MAVVKVEQKGDFNSTYKLLKKIKEHQLHSVLEKYGQQGVEALREATPKQTGATANAWYYEIVEQKGGFALEFKNSNVVDGWFNVAIMLQYGHGTKNGGWVEGRDYINPAIQPILDEIAKQAWAEVINS